MKNFGGYINNSTKQKSLIMYTKCKNISNIKESLPQILASVVDNRHMLLKQFQYQ